MIISTHPSSPYLSCTSAIISTPKALVQPTIYLCHLLRCVLLFPTPTICLSPTHCQKYLLHCVFIPSKHAVTGLLPPLALPCPPPPIPTIPSWTHQFAATTNSSNHVMAASVAFLAKNGNEFHKVRLLDRIQKKQAKQEKFLKVVTGIVDSGCLITIEEINREVFAFNGMTSYPPPPISPLPM